MYQYLKIGIRQLLKDKTYSIVNLIGLVIGMTSVILIFYTLKHELSFDHFHTDSKQIYRVVQHNHTSDGIQYWNTTAYPLAEALHKDFPDLEAALAVGPMQHTMGVGEAGQSVIRFEEKLALYVDDNYLQLFDFGALNRPLWLEGDPATALKAEKSVVITEKTAQKYFAGIVAAGESVIGQTLLLDNRDLLTVTGIVSTPPSNTNLLFDFLIPYRLYQKQEAFATQNWSGNYQGTTYVKLLSQSSPTAVAQKIANWKKNYLFPEDIERIEYRLQPLADIHTNATYNSPLGSYTVNKKLLGGLAIMACLLIIIPSVNVINLAIAQVSRRSAHVGIRKILGGSRLQLIKLFLVEILLLVITSCLFSIILAELLMTQINQKIDIVTIHLALDSSIILLGAGLILCIGLLAGIYPALKFATFSPASALKKEKDVGLQRGVGFRKSLIGLQFSIANVFIIGTIVVALQMMHFKTADLGFNQEAIFTINIPDQDSSRLQSFAHQLTDHPHIDNISFATGTPLTNDNDSWGTEFRLRHEEVQMMRAAEMKVVDLNYQDVFDLDLIAGKWLSRANQVERFNGFIANEALVHSLGFTPEEAIGQALIINEGEAPIIGVVKDFHNNTLHEAVSPCLIFHWNSGFYYEGHIALSSHATLSSTLSFINDTWHTSFPESIYKGDFLEAQLAHNYIIEELVFSAFQLFSFIAIFIAIIGLYALASFVVVSRTKEIGIRKVIGASTQQIIQLITQDFLRPVVLAIVISVPVAWYVMNQWLNNFTYRIELDWWIFALGGGIAFLMASLTVGWRSLTAAISNPIDALRNE